MTAGPRRCLLVVPAHAVNPRMGGGQRTGLFFGALKRIGPTEVAVLGEAVAPGVEEFFPGHAGLHHIPTARFPHRSRRGLRLLLANLRRFAFVDREYSADPAVRARLEALLGRGPAIVVHRYVAALAVDGLRSRAGGPAVCVDIDDRDDQKFLSAARRALPAPLLWLFRRLVLPQIGRVIRARLGAADFAWLAAPEDAAGMAALPLGVVPNVPFHEPPAVLPPASAGRGLLFVGTFGHRPNRDGVRWFLRHCWPAIRARRPQAVLRLVGLGDWPSLAAEFPGLEGVDYVGTVEDLGPEYARARLVVSPLFEGGGSKIKVIEACAFRRPVVATPHSARGFGAALAAALPQAETPAAFADLCLHLLGDDAAADALAERLHALQQDGFSRRAAEARIVADIGRVLPAAAA